MTALPCGCCEPGDPGHPTPPENVAGLDRLLWRIRRHPEFLAAMTAGIGRSGALHRLKTREGDDPTIALLDAWAAVGDVLTFYTERAANEGFLRTATERRSLAELAAMVGYELQPGVAAETQLAFTLETAAGAPEAVTIPIGTQVQSLPGPDEQPVLFETVEELAARAEWGAVPAESVDGSRPATGLSGCVLAGPVRLQAGDLLLFTRRPDPGSKNAGEPDVGFATVEGTTPSGPGVGVGWTPPLPGPVGRDGARLGPSSDDVTVHRPSLARPFGHNAPDWRTLPSDVVRRYGGGEPGGDWTRLTMDDVGLPAFPHPSGEGGSRSGAASRRKEPRPRHAADVLHLDGDDLDVRVGDVVVLVDAVAGRTQSFRVLAVATTSLTDFSLTRPVTRLTLSGPRTDFTTAVRTTVAHLPGRPLPLAPFPRSEPHAGTHVPLGRAVTPVPDGRAVAATGRRARVAVTGAELELTPDEGGGNRPLMPGARLVVLAPPETAAGGSTALRWHVQDAEGRRGTVIADLGDLPFVPASEDGPAAAEIAVAGTPDDAQVTETARLVLRQPLREWYDPVTLRFDANVVRATHGESTSEILGDGDAAAPFRRFTLKQSPLTYRTTAEGATSTLVVRVGGVRWQEHPTLFELPGDTHAYTLRHVEQDVVVQFGDGLTGARTPTGRENITAGYRIGGGRAGNVAAGSLSQLRARPLGVKGVTNPVPAEGGDDEESVTRARRDAPLRVRTLDRVVSAADYEDFAASYPGVGTAAVTWMWDGRRRTVHVTCTGPDGTPLPELTRTNLRTAINAASDGLQPFVIDPAEDLTFAVTARLYLTAAQGDRGTATAPSERDRVRTAAVTALVERFAPASRPLARPVPASEVIATLHAVPAVRGVDLLDLRLAGATGPAVERSLPARAARIEAGTVRAAQLLAVDPHLVEVVT